MAESYSDATKDRVKNDSDIRYCIPGADRTKKTSYVPCPKCGATGKNKGLCVTHDSRKNLAHCFSCGFSLTNGVAATLFYEYNDDRSQYIEALKATAAACGIPMIPEKREQKEHKQKAVAAPKRVTKSFCQKQLEASGLTEKDVMVRAREVVKGKVIESEVPAMRRGSIDMSGIVHPGDDEMLIYYYGLDGSLQQFATRGARGALRPYIRIRWSNPSLHTPEGSKRENKYMSPKDAPTRFYIPQRIRDLYEKAAVIPTLLIQEGEKKAEKACKHGVPSLAIQGIFNIGNKSDGLPQDLQYIVQRCNVRNVVLLFDSDWNALSQKLNPDEAVDYRPRMFSKAAIKFKKYVASMHNIGVNVDIFFGHINENEQGDKGVDDLLVGTLKGKEDEFAKDIDFALHAHDGKGKYCSIHNISTCSDIQIQDYWSLNDIDSFFDQHAEAVRPLKVFKFNRFRYKVTEEGKVELASKVIADKEFWTVDPEKGRVSLETFEALTFIEQAGFFRIHTNDLPQGEYKFIHIEDNIAHEVSGANIREFVWEYIKMTSKDQNVRNHFSARLSSDLAADKLERIERIEDTFDEYRPFEQMMFFENGMVTVTPQGIKYDKVIARPVWEHRVIKHQFERVGIIDRVEVDPVTGAFKVVPTNEGRKCDFFNFLCHTSDFWHHKGGPATQEEIDEFNRHLLNKITAIGFLLTDYKYQSELKAVIAMDGELSDVGQSNGRTGKSLIGKALSYMMHQTTIDGRNTKNDDDFMFTRINMRTRNVFLDDVAVNFNFERFYMAVTGDLNINVKGGGRFSIENEKSPKFYITTNHAINGSQTRSSQERIIYMSFSNYFNDTRHPIDVFGHQFFADWSNEQWNLFYNFMVECAFLYITSMNQGWARPGQGAIMPPMHDIMLRTLRQQMTESIYQWAEVYFDATGHNLNSKVPRKTMFDEFKQSFPDMRSGISQANFKTKLKFYCMFKGFHFNPNRLDKDGHSFRSWIANHSGESFIGTDDKSGGVEYISIYDTAHAMNEPF
jgi:hypothetical protein